MKLFDGTYDSVGNSETNLVLKTKGKIKIQYGNKFIDLIKDGKINASSTEWVHKLLPYGSIIMFNGTSSIPEGWQLCDGTNNTPDLTEYFISDSTSEVYLAVLIMKTI